MNNRVLISNPSKSLHTQLWDFEVTTSALVQYDQYKIKCLQNSFAGSLWKVNITEEYIKKRIGELCNEKKLSAEEVSYLFTNNYKFC